jgi:hypothetical protein
MEQSETERRKVEPRLEDKMRQVWILIWNIVYFFEREFRNI